MSLLGGNAGTGRGFLQGTVEGERIRLPGWDMRVMVAAEDSDGALTLIEGQMHPGHPGPPPHRHADHAETFVLLSGRLRFRLGDSFITAAPGQTVFAGRRLAHGFGNPFGEPAHYVLVLTPSGYEGYFRSVGQAVASTGALPGEDALRELMARHSTVPVPWIPDPGRAG